MFKQSCVINNGAVNAGRWGNWIVFDMTQCQQEGFWCKRAMCCSRSPWDVSQKQSRAHLQPMLCFWYVLLSYEYHGLLGQQSTFWNVCDAAFRLPLWLLLHINLHWPKVSIKGQDQLCVMFWPDASGGSQVLDESQGLQPSGHWLHVLEPLTETRAWTDTVVTSAAKCFVRVLELIKLSWWQWWARETCPTFPDCLLPVAAWELMGPNADVFTSKLATHHCSRPGLLSCMF